MSTSSSKRDSLTRLPMPKYVIVLADSHMGALNLGLNAFLARYPDSAFRESLFFNMVDVGNIARELYLDLAEGRRVLNPVLVKALDAPTWGPPNRTAPVILNRWNGHSPLAEQAHELIVLLGFSEMHVFAIQENWQQFGINARDFEDTRKQPPQDGEAPVHYALPEQLIRETLARSVDPVFYMVARLREAGLNVSTMPGPPPVPARQGITASFPTWNPPSRYTRRTVYRLLIDLYRCDAERNGYRFLDFSGIGADEEGFRQPAFWGDGIHANDEYGTAILRALDEATHPDIPA